MTNQEATPWAYLLDVLLVSAKAIFPGPALERLITRLEGRP